MSKILAVKINPDPISIIFGSSKDIKKLMPPQRQFVAYGLLIAKKLVLLFWKDKETPKLKMWITNLMDALHLERIRFAFNNKLEDFNKIWHPLVSHLAGDTGPKQPWEGLFCVCAHFLKLFDYYFILFYFIFYSYFSHVFFVVIENDGTVRLYCFPTSIFSFGKEACEHSLYLVHLKAASQ